MTERVSITDAASRLGVHPATIRRRMKSGELAGVKQQTPQGFVWQVELPDGTPPAVDAVRHVYAADAGHGSDQALIDELRAALDRERSRADEAEARRRQEVDQLHVMLNQAQRLLPMTDIAHADQHTDRVIGDPRPAPSFWQRVFGSRTR